MGPQTSIPRLGFSGAGPVRCLERQLGWRRRASGQCWDRGVTYPLCGTRSRPPAEPGAQTPEKHGGVSVELSCAFPPAQLRCSAALGKEPSCGNDKLTQQAELGALSSCKHSFLRWKRLKKPSCFPSSAAELEGGIKVPWEGREIQALCLPFRKNTLGVLSLNKQKWCGNERRGPSLALPPVPRGLGTRQSQRATAATELPVPEINGCGKL